MALVAHLTKGNPKPPQAGDALNAKGIIDAIEARTAELLEARSRESEARSNVTRIENELNDLRRRLDKITAPIIGDEKART